MTSMLSRSEIAAIKTATYATIDGLGGIDAAATVCRYERSALSDAQNHAKPARTLPVDVVADIERALGNPLITRVLAGLSGHALIPLPKDGGPEAQAIAQVMSGAASLGADFAAAMSDARITAPERQAIKDRLLSLHATCAQAVAALDSASERERA
jgi:hypothetical protein